MCHKQIVQTATVQAAPAGLAASVPRWFPGAPLSAVDAAGFAACVRHRVLTKAGLRNMVVNPASIAVAATETVKTDRRDAKHLALDWAAGRLRGLSIPTEGEDLARLLPRTRAQIVAHRATIARQLPAKLPQFGVIAPASRRLLSHRAFRESAAWSLPPERPVRRTLWAEQGRLATRQRSAMRHVLREQAPAQPAIETVYRSVPGRGEVAARPFAPARGDMTRFAKERALCSSTGLTPSAYASGASVRRGHLSRQGSSRVRHVLVEIAWRAMPRDAGLKEICDRIAATRGKKRAMVAIARRLTGRMRAGFRQGPTSAVGTSA